MTVFSSFIYLARRVVFIATALALFSTSCARADEHGTFIAGADVSDYPLFQSLGVRYLDKGQPQDLHNIAKNHGLNCIRLRLFTSSNDLANKSPYEYINNLRYTLPLAVHASQLRLPWILDFHYSDSWADSTHQAKPQMWEGLAFPQLESRMYQYNRQTIEAFRKANAMPAYVQLGNEITDGIVWPDGATKSPGGWRRLARLLNAAIQGVHDAAGPQMPKIIIHIDCADEWDVIRTFFDHLQQNRVEYDIIGLSYYPDSTSNITDLQSALANTANRYGRPILILETAFPWSPTSVDGDPIHPILGITPGPKGQVEFIRTLCRAMQNVPNNLGAGVVWWGAEYQPVDHLDLGGYENSSFFDGTGNLLPAIDALALFAR
jgi:arabinogalactan endo-1,4-beta-galactosidase